MKYLSIKKIIKDLMLFEDKKNKQEYLNTLYVLNKITLTEKIKVENYLIL